MNTDISYCVILFKSVNHTMWADNILKKAEIPHKLVPVPRQISSDCGVCIRLDSNLMVSATETLKEKIEYSEIREI